MPLAFTKMHGLGNDYVYVSTFDQPVRDPAELARVISDRHFGVGGDGLILIARPSAGCDAHARMEMYNADGSRAQMCGNGVRCVAKYVWDRGLARCNPLRIETDAGVLTLELTLDERQRVAAVRVDMGTPRLEPADIPVRLAGSRAVNVPFDALPAPAVSGAAIFDAAGPRLTCVSMGNPHAVFFVSDLAAVPLREWGPIIEAHPLFPQRVNAHFARVVRRDLIEMKTWERGTGPTLACGTGACAVVVAAVLTERAGCAARVRLPGGELFVEWSRASDHVFKTGPAVEVFSGTWPDPSECCAR